MRANSVSVTFLHLSLRRRRGFVSEHSLISGTLGLQVYGPTHVCRPGVVEIGAVKSFLSDFFYYQLQHPVLFEANICMAQAVRLGPLVSSSKELVYHHGNTLRRLRRSLMAEKGYDSDANILAIQCLLGMDYILNDMTAFGIHMNGMNSLVAARGGIDEVGWQAITKPSFEALQTAWTVISARIQKSQETYPDCPPDKVVQIPEYPKHPFNPQLCATIAKLPQGLSEIALKRVLSLPVIESLAKTATWTKEMESLRLTTPKISVNRYQAEDFFDMLSTMELNTTETLLCLGVLAHCISSYSNAEISSLDQRRLDLHMRKLRLNLKLWTYGDKATGPEDVENECLIWSAMVVAATTGEGEGHENQEAWSIFVRVMDEYEFARSWNLLKCKLSKFFWNDTCEAKWFACWKNIMTTRFGESLEVLAHVVAVSERI